MRVRLAFISVIAVATIAAGQPRTEAIQDFETVTDPEVLQIYALVVPLMWANKFKDTTVVIQRETEDVTRLQGLCGPDVPSPEPEWVALRKQFLQVNARRKALPTALPISQPYRLVTFAEIEQHDAPIKLKYENYTEHAEAHQHVVVSAVAFNADKTKAIVYAALRDQGRLWGFERHDGEWAVGMRTSVCTWIA